MAGFKEYRAGDRQISAADFNAVLADSARRQSALGAAGVRSVDMASASIQGEGLGDLFLINLTTTGVVDGSVAKYGWERRVRGVSGNSYGPLGDTQSGTPTNFPAIEPNGNTALTGIVAALIADSQDALEIIPIGAASSEVSVLVQGFVNFQDSACGSGDTGSGECGSGASSGQQCRSIYHHAVLQVKVCGVWCDSGCVWVEDINGQKLETGRRYHATLVGPAPAGLEAVVILQGDGACSPSPVLYSTDAGNRTFIILVGDPIGTLCGSGSVGGGTSQSLGGLSPTLQWSRGTAYGYSDVACAWLIITDLIIADPRGCKINPGDIVTGHFNRMVSNGEINGTAGSGDTGDSGCTPSYLLDRAPKTGVDHIQCCIGGGILVYSYIGQCGLVSVTNCGCTSTGSGLTGSGACGFEAVPPHYTFPIAGVTNNLCLNCASWNGNWTVTYDGNNCWTNTVSISCPGLSCTGFTLCCDGTNMNLDICGATYTLPLASWNPLGSNVMTLVTSNTTICSGWPPTITVTAAE